MSDPILVVALLLAGFGLLFLELVVVPGFTFFGLAGILFLLVGFVLSYTRLGGEQTLFLLIVSSALGTFLFWWAGRVGAWRGLVRGETQRGTSSQRSTIAALVGKRGEAISALRPAGKVNIDGRRVDVVAEGGFIEKGDMVEVIRVDGNRVVVRKGRFHDDDASKS